MRDTLPDSVLYREKSWADAVVSREWVSAGVRWMQGVLPTSPGYLGIEDEGWLAGLRHWAPRAPQGAVTALAFWHRVFTGTTTQNPPPTWSSLSSR